MTFALTALDRVVALGLAGDRVGGAEVGLGDLARPGVERRMVRRLAKSRGSLAALSASLMIASITGWKPLWPNMTAPSMSSSDSSLASDSTISTASPVPATTRSSFDSVISSICGLST